MTIDTRGSEPNGVNLYGRTCSAKPVTDTQESCHPVTHPVAHPVTHPGTHPVTHPVTYVNKPFAGIGQRVRPRSWVHTDAWELDLSGTWNFEFHPQVPAQPPCESQATCKIEVPSHFSLTNPGKWGSPIYTNVIFPIPVTPPMVPVANPTGDYHRTFTLPAEVYDRGGDFVIRLEGAESCAEIWVNGKWVGTTQGSRLAQEINISSLVKPGENSLAIRVRQWSVGTYLEDQDQWWLGGLYREVKICHRPQNGIEDLRIVADYDHQNGHGWLSISLDGTNPLEDVGEPTEEPVEELAQATNIHAIEAANMHGIEATNIHGIEFNTETSSLSDHHHHHLPTPLAPEANKTPVYAELEIGGKVQRIGIPCARVDVGQVAPWSADIPTLYRLTVTSPGETVTIQIGFRRIEIVDGQLLANGKPLKLHGVNRHEIRADAGRIFDEEFARADLALMKSLNVNAIRTSHYPPHPKLIDLCDEMGLWVMDECDIETHGFELDGWKQNPSDDPEWAEAILDRMRRFVARDYNHPAVIIWSLGNESHTGSNLKQAASIIHYLDSSRPVHYEGDYGVEYVDIYSRMYPSIETMRLVIADDETDLPVANPEHRAGQIPFGANAKIRKMPFVLCEYAHAMGTGPGGVKEYVEIMAHRRSLGGFVWEWRDHALKAKPQDPNCREFCYGGDFGEEVHDGNFVCDGLVDASGNPSSGLFNWANLVAPVVAQLEDAKVVVHNRMHARSTSGIKLCWQVQYLDEQRVLQQVSGELDLPPVVAGGTATMEISEITRLRAEYGEIIVLLVLVDTEAQWAKYWRDGAASIATASLVEVSGPECKQVGTLFKGGQVISYREFGTIELKPVVCAGGRSRIERCDLGQRSTLEELARLFSEKTGKAASAATTDISGKVDGKATENATGAAADEAENRTGARVETCDMADDFAGLSTGRNRVSTDSPMEAGAVVKNDDNNLTSLENWVRAGEIEVEVNTARVRLASTGWPLDLQACVWRVPTDNDNGHNAVEYWECEPTIENFGSGRGYSCDSAAERWKKAGLHRLRTRPVSVQVNEQEVCIELLGVISGSQKCLRVAITLSPISARYPNLGRKFGVESGLTAGGSFGDCVSVAAPAKVAGASSGVWAASEEKIDDSIQPGTLVEVDFSPVGDWPLVVPRLGLLLRVPTPTAGVAWFGYGPQLSYPDMSDGVYTDFFRASWQDLWEETIRPQEAGNRANVRYLELGWGSANASGSASASISGSGSASDSDGGSANASASADMPACVNDGAVAGAGSLRLWAMSPLNFSLSAWDASTLENTRHWHELPEVDESGVWLHLDAAVNGLGSRSCGPDVRPEYQLRDLHRRLSFVLQ